MCANDASFAVLALLPERMRSLALLVSLVGFLSALRGQLIKEVADVLVTVGQCPHAMEAVFSAVESTMESHGGYIPHDALLSSLWKAGVSPVALLHIVHQSNQVQQALIVFGAASSRKGNDF